MSGVKVDVRIMLKRNRTKTFLAIAYQSVFSFSEPYISFDKSSTYFYLQNVSRTSVYALPTFDAIT